MNKQKMIDSFRILSKAASDIADALSENDVVSINEPIKNDANDLPMFVNIKKAKEITGFKEYFIRKLCNEKKLKYKTVGNKIYINTQSIIDYENSDENA